MILLDPDLEPDPALSILKAPQTGARKPLAPWADRIPSERTLQRFLAEAQAAVRLRGQVSVLLTTDKAIRRLNRQFRGKDKATDVLSFPADSTFAGAEKIAGDLAISVPTARKQAATQGHALTCELKVLLLHGLLHLAGYDHEADEGQMARREQKLRAQFRLPLGLIERARTTVIDPAQKVRTGLSHPGDKTKGVARVGHPAIATSKSRKAGARVTAKKPARTAAKRTGR
jgi:probable rRNA maturation factor